jgi:phosphoribosyl 1,2-cyclic phosphate phosphodiesterase
MQPHPAFTITFLGTGTSGGVPLVGCSCYVCTSPHAFDKRLRSSILVESATTRVVIDASPDFRQQMLRHRVPGIDAILLTHPHKDHIGGIDDTRGFQFLSRQPTRIYGNELSLLGVKAEIPYAFEPNPYPGVPVVELISIDLTPFTIGDIPFVPILVWHHLMPVYGYRIGPFTYITDANRIEPAEMDKIRGSNTLVLNALRYEPHISHFTLPEAIALVQSLQVPQAYFTHISHQLGRHSEVAATLPPGMDIAYDGLQLKFNAG